MLDAIFLNIQTIWASSHLDIDKSDLNIVKNILLSKKGLYYVLSVLYNVCDSLHTARVS